MGGGDGIQRWRSDVSSDVLHAHVAHAVRRREDLLIFKAAPRSRWRILALKLPQSHGQILLPTTGRQKDKHPDRNKTTISSACVLPSALHFSDASCSFFSSVTLSPPFIFWSSGGVPESELSDSCVTPYATWQEISTS